MTENRLDSLIPATYAELRRVAAYHLRFENGAHTFRPTDLVHEAYLKLKKQNSDLFVDRVHFLSIASLMMRRVLVDHARMRKRNKRGNGLSPVQIDASDGRTEISVDDREIDLIELEEALEKLEALDERQARIVEFHFFGGLSFEEIAGLLEISRSTVMREWRLARNWLYLRLEPAKAGGAV